MAGVEVPRETREDEFELSLELSVCGSYGKSDGLNKINGRTTQTHGTKNDAVRFAPRSNFSCVVKGLFGENGSGFSDSEMIHRQKVQGNVHESRGLNGGSLREDKIILETRKFRFRVQDRRSKEEELLPEEGMKRKQERRVENEVVRDLNLSFCSDNKLQKRCLFPQVEYLPSGTNGYASYSVGVPSLEANVGKEEENKVDNVFYSENCNPEAEPQEGGSIGDSGSQTSTLIIPAANETSSHIEPDQVVATPKQGVKAISMATPRLRSRLSKTSEGSTTSSLTNKRTSPPSRGTNDLMKRPPKAPDRGNKGASAPYMPCVSTTGNGPNGKTITGFLYKYTKDEVSIMCVCHGIPFSPVGFVEHAGGIGTSNPLRHIRVLPFNLGT